MTTNLCFLRFKIWQHFMQMRRCFLEFVINHNIWRVKVQLSAVVVQTFEFCYGNGVRAKGLYISMISYGVVKAVIIS